MNRAHDTLPVRERLRNPTHFTFNQKLQNPLQIETKIHLRHLSHGQKMVGKIIDRNHMTKKTSPQNFPVLKRQRILNFRLRIDSPINSPKLRLTPEIDAINQPSNNTNTLKNPTFLSYKNDLRQADFIQNSSSKQSSSSLQEAQPLSRQRPQEIFQEQKLLQRKNRQNRKMSQKSLLKAIMNNHIKKKLKKNINEFTVKKKGSKSSWSNSLPVESECQKCYNISYKTSLSKLKSYFLSFTYLQKIMIDINIPSIFLQHWFYKKLLQLNEAQQWAAFLFQKLGLPSQSLNIRKYSNCTQLINNSVCLICYGNEWQLRKVYLGGWRNEYFDEGVRHGLGLEWVPRQSVYYGQFVSNKKHGLGVRKNNDGVYFGLWNQGRSTQKGYQIDNNFCIQPLENPTQKQVPIPKIYPQLLY